MRSWAVLAVIFVATLVLAQPKITVFMEPGPGTRPGKYLVYLVDVSGSMAGARLTKALEAFDLLAGQPVDQAYLRVDAFAGSHRKRRWAKLPSADELAQAEAWLSKQFYKLDSSTRLLPALVEALAEKPKALTIVIVTDGELGEDRLEDLETEIKAAQRKRKVKALIGVVGVGHSKPRAKLKRIAELGRGGYCAIEVPKEGPH